MANSSIRPQAGAFLLSPMVSSRTRFGPQLRCRAVPKRVRTRAYVRACIPTDEPKASSDTKPSAETSTISSAEKKSKTEEIAALLGQSKGDMEEKAAAIRERTAADNRLKYGLAFVSVVVSTTLFFAQYFDPNSTINLMHFMAESSTPVDVVGQNGKPTLIEFSATWCENCKYMARRVYELENEYAGKVNFVIVDGEDPARQTIVDKYGVDAIPQFSMISKDGDVQTNLIGLIPKEVLAKDLDSLLKEEVLPFKGVSLEQLRGPAS